MDAPPLRRDFLTQAALAVVASAAGGVGLRAAHAAQPARGLTRTTLRQARADAAASAGDHHQRPWQAG